MITSSVLRITKLTNTVETHSRSFVGRKKLLDQLVDYANGTLSTPMVVIGEPGGGEDTHVFNFNCEGKTSLVATFSRDYIATQQAEGSTCLVVAHFIGGAAGSTDIRRFPLCIVGL